MHLKDGAYYPSHHIAEELQKFPNEKSFPQAISTILGICNLSLGFCPKITKFMSPLQQMLKKYAPP